METPQYVLIRESFISSILMDIFSWLALLLAFYVNVEYVGSKILSGFILIIFMLTIHSKLAGKMKKFYSKEEFKKYVETL